MSLIDEANSIREPVNLKELLIERMAKSISTGPNFMDELSECLDNQAKPSKPQSATPELQDSEISATYDEAKGLYKLADYIMQGDRGATIMHRGG